MVCDRLPAREATANAHSADACGSDVIALLRHDRTRTAIIIQLKVPSDKIWLLDRCDLESGATTASDGPSCDAKLRAGWGQSLVGGTMQKPSAAASCAVVASWKTL